MVQPARPPANAFVATVRRIYNPIGYAKGYNFILWFILAGALMGFVLARFMYLDIDGILCYDGPDDGRPDGTLPSECFYYERIRGRVGILLHLSGILPAGFLVVFQFTPVIRHKMIIVHRVTGYLVLLLSLVSTAGVLMIAKFSFGGGLPIQVGVGVASILFIVEQALAYYNIKKLQIEQHRAWMLRAWVMAGFIITMRIIGVLINEVLQAYQPGDMFFARSCEQIDWLYDNDNDTVLSYYPDCSAYYSNASPNLYVAVQAFTGNDRIEQLAAGLSAAMEAAAWLAIAIHVIGVEIYLRLTPAEFERLRRISYQRQLEAGMRNPGNAGLTVERLGDALGWTPPGSEAAVLVGERGKTSDADTE